MALLETFVAEPPPLRVDAGGTVRVGPTRVTLDTVIFAFNSGCTPEQIVSKFDTLALDDVYGVISYYLRHRTEVDTYMEQREREAGDIRRQIEAHSPPVSREQLLARQAQKRRESQSL